MERTYDYTYRSEQRKLALLVDKNLIELARQNNINLSRFLEEKLRELLNMKISMGPPRFELGSPAPQAGRITRLPYGPFKERQG